MSVGTSNRTSMHRDAVAIGVATGAYAVSYGVLAVAAGLSVAQTCAMSALVFTGASQFAVVGVLGAGGGALAALAPALLLAARNAVYGLALVPVLPGRRAPRVPGHRAQRLRLLERRDAARRAGRRRARRPARARPRRHVPGRVP